MMAKNPSRPRSEPLPRLAPSLRLVRYVTRREGIVLVPYRDGSGYSIGGGHFMGKKPTRRSITVSEAIKQIGPHLQERAGRVNDMLAVPILQHQFDAVLDTYYQGGSDGLEAVIKVINARDPYDPASVLFSDREAARELLQWDTSADGTHMSGLLMRCGRRVAMYLAGEYGSDLDLIPTWDRVDPETEKVRRADMKMTKVKDEDFAWPPR
jgi:GH24 family phage-related lysozyme (muramidase)